MAEYIEREALLAEYDRLHTGEPGRARKLIAEAPAADVVEVKSGYHVGDVCIYGFGHETKSNFDHIRSMTEDEMAEWIINGVSSDACDFCEYNNGYCDGSPCRGKADAEIIVDWLNRPYKDGE